MPTLRQTITFPSEPGFSYQVKGTSDLSDPHSWDDIGDPIVPVSGSSTTAVLTDPAIATESARFYEVEVSE